MQPSRINPSTIAKSLEMTEDELWKMARNIESSFRERRMQLVGKKHRPIDSMYKHPKKLFKIIHRIFQKYGFYHPRAHGGVRGRSCFTSARCHLGKKFVWIRDVQDCFPSISPGAFQTEMHCLGFETEMAELLTLLCTVRGGIPQGSPLSNDALNLYFWRIDQTLASYCGQNKLVYTRVADDLTISGNDKEAGIAAIRFAEKLLTERNLRISQKKKKSSGFRRREEKPIMHSIGVHDRRGTHVIDSHKKTALELAEKYRSGCKAMQPGSLVALASRRLELTGWMYYCRQAHFGPALQIRKLIEAGDRAVLKKLKELKLNSPQNKWWLITRRNNEPARLARIWENRISTAQMKHVSSSENT